MTRASGQTLLEVLVALSAAIIVLSAITVIVLSALNEAAQSSAVNQATQYAQEGMELAKGRGGFTDGQVFCLGSDEDDKAFVSGACTGPNIGTFKREVSVVHVSCGALNKVTVTVSWKNGACSNGTFCHSVPLATCM